ncbi:glycosyltransferase [Crocinitomix algicola]|uniref:glycosyltransferase n=1 Tax=Crocinitomix algicola TaxID=1740263 RepID=UPI00083564F9|nr:glycosyltransferase [Crocinitomix algicola]
MTITKRHILVLPRWYPNKTDEQLGIFIQRQIHLMNNDFRFTVAYAQGIPNLNSKYELTENKSNSFEEYRVYFRQNTGLLKKVINFYRYRKALKMAIRRCNSKIDLIHTHVPYRTTLFALKLKRKLKIPLVITEHWSGHLNGKFQAKNKLDKILYKKVLAQANNISTVSKTLQKAFKKNTGYHSVCIPNIIERHTNSSTIKKEGINILSVSDFVDETKNISDVLKAFRKIVAVFPKAKLTLVGGGPDEGKIHILVKDLEFPSGTLNLTGRLNHKDVLKIMATSDLYVCNSRHETFGMTVAEALYAGTPVVCTRCGGPEEFLNESNSILINSAPVNSSNQDQLYKAISELIVNIDTYNSTEIQRNIENKYGQQVVREKWLSFYTHAII